MDVLPLNKYLSLLASNNQYTLQYFWVDILHNPRNLTFFKTWKSAFFYNFSFFLLSSVCISGTLDGSICDMLPVTEKVYRRLLMLQNIMATGMQHLAGLNPKAFRY